MHIQEPLKQIKKKRAVVEVRLRKGAPASCFVFVEFIEVFILTFWGVKFSVGSYVEVEHFQSLHLEPHIQKT